MPIGPTIPLATAALAGVLAFGGAVTTEALPATEAAAPRASYHPGAHPGPHGRPAARRIERLCRIAQCTDDQREAIRGIYERGRKATQADRKRLRALHEKMRAEWKKPTLDRDAILRLHDEIAQVKAALGRKRLERRIEALSALSPQQRQRLADARAAHHAKKHGKKRGKKRGEKRGKNRGAR